MECMVLRVLSLNVAFWFLLIGNIHATSIIWTNTVFRTNVESDGETNFTDDWIFELGTFITLPSDTEEFIPTEANRSEWATHWARLDTTSYNTNVGLNFYTNNTNLESNDPPFVVGARAYVWGYSSSSINAEWILLTDEDWLYPEVVSIDGVPSLETTNFDLRFDSGSIAITGAIDPNGPTLESSSDPTAILMQSAPASGNTSPADRSFIDWSEQNFSFLELSNQQISGPLADPDGNGLSNLIEYAFFFESRDGTFTQSESDIPNRGLVLEKDSTDPNIINASFVKPFNTTDLEYTFQVSSDAMMWVDIDLASIARIEISSPANGAETVTLRDIRQIPGLLDVGLVRVKVDLLPGSGTPVTTFAP